jgi:hypothetical protein
MSKAKEHVVEKTLRWMTENLRGAYNAKHPPGHPKAGNHCVNSGTCILVCCYINALGKILLKGGPTSKRDRDFMRFREFLQRCMRDFLNESNTRGLPSTPGGRSGGDGWLYEVFRCGFVHSFYPSTNVAWGRNPRSKKYWFDHRGRLTLNIDELVRGFERGLVEFRSLIAADIDLRTRFKEYILAR